MAATKRTPFEIHRDRLLISDLYLQQRTQQEIAEILKKDLSRKYTLTQQTISRDILAIQADWKERAVMNLDTLKAKELAKIDQLERKYYEEWERSRTDEVKSESEKATRNKSAHERAKIIKYNRLGDSRYLSGVQWCIEKRCELLGLNAPRKIEHAGKLQVDDSLSDRHIDEKINELLHKAGVTTTSELEQVERG